MATQVEGAVMLDFEIISDKKNQLESVTFVLKLTHDVMI